MKKRKRHIPRLLRQVARVAKSRYGSGVKPAVNHSHDTFWLTIKFVRCDRTILDEFTVSVDSEREPSLHYERNVWLQWEPSDTAVTVMDDLEEIRVNTVRTYWKAHPPKP
jgi:hypothetical protein